ncbi:MAG: 4Fe-4S binding protein [Desulfuromonadales bacterium]|nr:4Fe-4S binding protein [Desulfuromonadales bacterium]NIR32950.1 4Fe-4S binding protein [Desulfuromonadales bacterium]NIS39853.1 4Fe-4S binding protein [Desulfuromonadales bacterium]
MSIAGASVSEARYISPQRSYHWVLGAAMMAVIALGWKYPLLGLAAPVVMGAGMGISIFRGRWVCGNLCPRGSFFDTALKMVVPERKPPRWLRSMPFRWAMVAVLLGVTAWQGMLDPMNIEHWGLVFWRLCLVTTAVGVVFAFAAGARAWCAFCPMGTIQNGIGGHKQPLQIDRSCQHCLECESNCPMGLDIPANQKNGQYLERDCLRCSTCQLNCPSGALSWPKGG